MFRCLYYSLAFVVENTLLHYMINTYYYNTISTDSLSSIDHAKQKDQKYKGSQNIK